MATTIKVSVENRDRLRRWADAHDSRTLDDALAACLDAAETRDRMHEVDEAMHRMRREDPDAWAAYLEERDVWDRVGEAPGDARTEYPEYNT